MSRLYYEHYCNECGEVFEFEHRDFECPRCHSDNVRAFPNIECDCGEVFGAGRFTNECPNCGALYNGFGQKLADPSEMDDEDRYATFGPQN